MANGVVYTDSYSGYVYAIDAATGTHPLEGQTGGSVIDGPSMVNGVVYWGSGFAHIAPGTPTNKVYAVAVR